MTHYKMYRVADPQARQGAEERVAMAGHRGVPLFPRQRRVWKIAHRNPERLIVVALEDRHR